MRFPARLLTAVALGLLVASPRATAAQRLGPGHDWQRLQIAAALRITHTAPASPTAADSARDANVQSPQRIRYGTPTPYVIGGSAVGAFAGGVIGYATCVAGDGDCSMLVRLAAGTGIGAFLGAVFWLASAVER